MSGLPTPPVSFTPAPDRRFASLISTTGLGGRSLAPRYDVPDVPVAAKYRSQGPWTSASPTNQLDRAGSWKLYRERELDDLEPRLIVNNPDLRAALFHCEQAEAYIKQVSSQLYPEVSTADNVKRERESDTRPLRNATALADYNTATLGAEVDYEVDLWGRVRDSVAASKDERLASNADLASTQLSLETALARSYIDLRGLDQQIDLIDGTDEAYQKALDLTRSRHGGEIMSGLDMARLPVIPVGMPSALLQRRSDIAAAERRIAEASAKIGFARAAYFPTLTLSAQGGVQSSVYADLRSAPSSSGRSDPHLRCSLRWWQAGRTGEFRDGGNGRGRLALSSVALASFRQVEDDLSLLYDLGIATGQQQDAASAADTSVNLSLLLYQRGAVSYVDVVEYQSAALESERSAIALRTQQLDANVDLVRALGGGWTRDDMEPNEASVRSGRF